MSMTPQQMPANKTTSGDLWKLVWWIVIPWSVSFILLYCASTLTRGADGGWSGDANGGAYLVGFLGLALSPIIIIMPYVLTLPTVLLAGYCVALPFPRGLRWAFSFLVAGAVFTATPFVLTNSLHETERQAMGPDIRIPFDVQGRHVELQLMEDRTWDSENAGYCDEACETMLYKYGAASAGTTWRYDFNQTRTDQIPTYQFALRQFDSPCPPPTYFDKGTKLFLAEKAKNLCVVRVPKVDPSNMITIAEVNTQERDRFRSKQPTFIQLQIFDNALGAKPVRTWNFSDLGKYATPLYLVPSSSPTSFYGVEPKRNFETPEALAVLRRKEFLDNAFVKPSTQQPLPTPLRR
jgi:hypothetical protein